MKSPQQPPAKNQSHSSQSTMPHVISKTGFVLSRQCKKKLWLLTNRPNLANASASLHTEEGEEVGRLAREVFAPFALVKAKSPFEAARETSNYFQEGKRRICEASFLYDGLFCAADIIVVDEDGLQIYEVKSTTSVKNVQLDDIAFQYYVITHAGYHIKRVSILHLSADYIRGEALDLDSLFVEEDCTDAVLRQQGMVVPAIEECRATTALKEEPLCGLGLYCERPYECPFKQHCFQLHEVPEVSIFDVTGITAKKKYDLWNRGIITPEDMMRHSDAFTARQLCQISGLTNQEASNVDKDSIEKFLQELRYPLSLLDFETFQPAVPRFNGTRPYEQVPFQFSLHILTGPEAEPIHHEFLAKEGTDPRRAVAEALCQSIPEEGDTMAYNMSFERSVLQRLSDSYPDLSTRLTSMRDRMCDLMVPFSKKWYYIPEMKGSYSIKAVLPALCGDDPDLDYHKLPVVHNGSEAMSTFSTLHLLESREEIDKIRQGLLLYCGLDTLAMVKVLSKLYEIVEGR